MSNKRDHKFLLNGCDEHLKTEIISVCEMIVGRPAIWKLRKIFKKTFKRFRRVTYRKINNDPTILEFTVKCHCADWSLVKKVLKMNYSDKVTFM